MDFDGRNYASFPSLSFVILIAATRFPLIFYITRDQSINQYYFIAAWQNAGPQFAQKHHVIICAHFHNHELESCSSFLVSNIQTASILGL